VSVSVSSMDVKADRNFWNTVGSLASSRLAMTPVTSCKHEPCVTDNLWTSAPSSPKEVNETETTTYVSSDRG